MTSPVNLENLRDMTGGDPAFERELFDVFLASAEEQLANLQKACSSNDNAAWKSSAHALKGMSLNLGAQKLGEICANAQANPAAAPEQKTAMLAEIKAEYEQVKTYLNSQK